MPGAEVLTAITAGIRKASQDSHNKYHNKTQDTDTLSMKTPPPDKDAVVKYEVRVITADRFNSSTRANVFITLFGADGDHSGVMQLDDKNDVNHDEMHVRFQRGQTDVFLIELKNFGELAKVRIGHDNSGMFPSWFLDRVEVLDHRTTNMYHFLCGRWLSVKEDDGQVVRDLPVEHQFQLTPQDFLKEAASNFTTTEGGGGPVLIKDYAPKVFRNIREMYDIHTKDYQVSWTLPEEKLVAKEGAGRSGSLFLLSDDNRYMLKTIPHDEVLTFLEVLPAYYQHLTDHPESLIMKVFGLMRCRLPGFTHYVIIFNNVLYNPPNGVNAIYDLKGRVPKPGKALQNTQKVGSNYVFKDKDLDRKFYLAEEVKFDFFTTLAGDINFFQANNLMDYSLLIGISDPPPAGQAVERPTWATVRPSRADKKELYHVGFIDCLTSYGLKKKTAHMFKTALWNPDTLSTIDATSYAERIKKYLFEIFEDSPNPLTPSLSKGRPRSVTSEGVGPSSADTILLQKKAEMLESKVLRLEGRMHMLEACLDRLLQARGEKGLERTASSNELSKFAVGGAESDEEESLNETLMMTAMGSMGNVARIGQAHTQLAPPDGAASTRQGPPQRTPFVEPEPAPSSST
eukprot:comp21883_c0_seq1/m.31324 comp21883_c0_seq1/g.31324  ORF comp21883_c0_seq1/g.31324 comp21883_c0_seq1/m.31324 type:complete len:627 (-) comp21883_c0_seq1:472-2352(-)